MTSWGYWLDRSMKDPIIKWLNFRTPAVFGPCGKFLVVSSRKYCIGFNSPEEVEIANMIPLLHSEFTIVYCSEKALFCPQDSIFPIRKYQRCHRKDFCWTLAECLTFSSFSASCCNQLNLKIREAFSIRACNKNILLWANIQYTGSIDILIVIFICKYVSL